MKTYHIFIKILLCILFPALGTIHAWGTNTYYARVTATAIGPTGAGTVYASSNEQNGTSGTNSTAVGTTNNSQGNISFTFNASPSSDIYDFKGWSTTNNVNVNPESTNNPYTRNFQASNNAGENNARSYDIYAIFLEKPIFYFSGTANVAPTGAGTASTYPSIVNARGDRWNSVSSTTTGIAFSATPSSDYCFIGWSETVNGTIVSTDNPYSPTLTSTSTNSERPTNSTLYARFQPYPTGITATPSSITLGSGDSSNPIVTTVIPAGAFSNIGFESSNTSIATVDTNGVVTAGSIAGNTTIIVKAFKNDGSTVVASTTVSVTVMEKCASPIITILPSSIGTTAIVTISSSTPSATIYYTTDGSDPTSSSTIYNDSFVINNGETVKAISVKDGYLVSDIASATYSAQKVSTPTINITSSGVTFDCETSGTTFYYTINNEDISTSSISGSSIPLSSLKDGDIIRVIATKTGMITSDIAAKTFYPASGVSDNILIINDYEDHNWSYYQSIGDLPSGYPIEYLSSPDPRNVKITYRGGGVTNGSSVAISALAGEGQNTMIYYKTLEKVVIGMTGDYPYTVISNPFSKRPATGSSNNKIYYGFAGWKIISGGSYISEYSDKDVLPLDATIHFTNLDNNYTPNCTSAVVIFEATWTTATVKTGNSAQSFNNGTYETNFWVLTSNPSDAVTIPANCTMTGRYPDGTVSFTGNFTRAITAGGNNAKVEWINMNSTGNVSAAGYTFTMGRGIVNTGNGGEIRGCTSDMDCVNTIKIESGKYASLRNFTNGLSSSRSCNQLMILGCDYDRAKNDNSKLSITGSMYVAGSSLNLNRSSNSLYVRGIIKSGDFLSGVAINNSYTGAGGTQSYYFSVGNSNTQNAGRRYLVMEGGIIKGIAGGMDESNNQAVTARAFDLRIRGTAQIDGVVYGAAEYANGRGIRTMVFTGGMIKGWIAGGANGTQETNGALTGATYLYVGGKTNVDSNNSGQVLNRAVGGNVFGAGCGYSAASSSGQILTYNTNVVVADESYVERGVYGGGSYGYTTNTSNIYVLGGHVGGKNGGVNGTTYQASITGGVFGGACQNRGGTVNIIMADGLVEGGVYGGSNATGALTGSVTMNINGGQVGTTSQTANIHGGGYGSATSVSGNVDLTLGTQNQTTPGVTVYGDVYGGSALGYVNGTAATNTYHTYVTMNKGIINGSLYGGGLGNASTAANVYGPVIVTVNGGTVNTTSANGSGAVYGCNNINGAPQRAVAVIINGTDPAPDEDSYALDAVYGGGNQANYAAGTPTVTVNNCDNSIDYVYGGGNAAHITNGNTDVTIFGGNKIGNVFGGGNGTQTAANVSGNTNVKIYGGTILNVFGGSNSQGTIGGTINVTVDSSQGTDCPMNIGNVYGGGNMASSNAGNLNIVCTGVGGHIDNIFGGANQANITGDIDLKINGGDIGNVFGGNNQSGEISGSIEVTVGNSPNNCETFKIENVYGGGNLAAYGHGDDYPKVNIVRGTISEGVYGGGYGESAIITGNPQVTVKGGTIGSIYGGGNAAAVEGNTVVSVKDAAVTYAIYGGSNAANISGTTTVDVISGTVGTGIYGGCNSEGTVVGDIAVNISGGTIGSSNAKANIHGGGYGSSTATSGNVSVNITGSTIYGDVYGGSALGNVNGSTSNTTMVNLTGGTIYGDAYGGGLGDSSNPAYVNGNVTVTLNGTAFVTTTTTDDEGNIIPASGRIFGCNNLNGTPKGTVLVKVLKTIPTNGSHTKGTYELQAVYGGGNLAAYDPTDSFAEGQFTEYTYSSVTASHDNTDKPVQVVIDGCEETSIEYVYGGGNAAPTPATDVVVIGCFEIGNVFGGGNGKDKYSLDGGTTWNPNNGADVGYKGTTSYGTGKSLASVYGGTVHYIFGGSNTKGNIRVIAEAAIDDASDCPLDVEEIYGGGNEAYMEGDSKISLGCIDFLQEIYGGAKNADVGGDIELTITSGHFDRVFGGNNLGGTIEGSITVNIEETGCNPITIGELYGCGNAAAYTTPSGKTDPTINIKSFTSIGRVFGGGLGEGAVVTGNPTVNINEVVGANASMTPTTIYAGTTRTLSDNTTVTLPDHTAGEIGAIGTVFGGGNAAAVHGNTNVYIGTKPTITYVSKTTDPIPVVGVDIRGNVYGGGNAADVTGSTNVVIGQ